MANVTAIFTCVLERKGWEEEAHECVCGLLNFLLPWKHTIKSSTNLDNHGICILERGEPQRPTAPQS